LIVAGRRRKSLIFCVTVNRVCAINRMGRVNRTGECPRVWTGSLARPQGVWFTRLGRVGGTQQSHCRGVVDAGPIPLNARVGKVSHRRGRAHVRCGKHKLIGKAAMNS
jgi:hypothetical protein